MGYAIMRLAKLKSAGEMSDRYNHDMRIFNVNNADPVLSSQNEELVDQLIGRSYADICDDTLRNLKASGAITREVRCDAVKGFDVYLGFSHEDTPGIDLEEWGKRCVEWLRETFNPPGGNITYTDHEGKEVTETIDNVKSVVMHMDEATPHLHAFVVPIDERGHLNARAYANGRDVISRLQDSYAQAMAPFGLWRGERHSSARHDQISAYYNKLLEAVEAELPEPEPGESIEEYHLRAEEAHQAAMVQQRNDIVKSERRLHRRESSLFDRTVEIAGREADFAEERRGYEAGHRRTERLLTKLADAVGEPDFTDGTIAKVRRDVSEHRQFKKALEEYPDRARARLAERSYNEMLDWQRGREMTEKRSKRNPFIRE